MALHSLDARPCAGVHLDARLDHGGALGVAAELVDELLHVRARLLLRLVLPLVLTQRLCPRRLEVVVVALEARDAL
eukprot:420970-Pleurochrysis_carterae.AAC.1